MKSLLLEGYGLYFEDEVERRLAQRKLANSAVGPEDAI